MDSLSPSTSVADVRGTANVPVEQRHETVKPTSTPDFQKATQALGESQNFLGAVGVQVAQSASNQMATQLGYETGKTPHGDLLPPVTEFDKNFAESYHQQASATLSLQGQKLLDDAHIEMSKPARLTPQLIERTQSQLQLGLNKIAEKAPTAIKGQLQSQFDSQVLQNTTQYKEKMIGQQREDQKNILDNGIDVAIKNALEFSTNGDAKGAQTALNSARQMADSAANSKLITPEEARVKKETAEQAKINGEYTFGAKKALNEKKYPEFIDGLSKNKPVGMSNENYMAMLSHVNNQIGFIQNLRTQQNNLDIGKFNVQMALNPTTISGSDIEKLREQLAPEKFEEVHLSYIKAMRSWDKDKSDSHNLMANWSDPRAHAASSGKVIDKTFEDQVGTYQQKGVPVQDAEVLVASQAGGVVPEFTRSVKNRLASPNPAMIESAAQQIHSLDQIGSGNALNGLNQQDLAMYHAFGSIRDSRDPNKAAQEAHDRIYNQDPDVTTANEQKWNNQLHDKKPTGVSLPDYGLMVAGIAKEKYLNMGDKTVFGNDLIDEYKSNYIASGGDDETARKMLQQSVKNNYGYTNINGTKEYTKHPIEKVLNLPDNAVGVVQQDIYNQLGKNFEANKKAYDAGQVNEYWELTPSKRKNVEDILSSKRQEAQQLLKEGYLPDALRSKNLASQDVSDYVKSQPIEVIKHTRGGKIGEKYTVMIKSNPFATTTNDQDHPTKAGWDIAVNSDAGTRSLARVAPYLGVITYDPDMGFIRSTYTKLHPLK